jgi:hypothetical protein
LFSPVLDDRYQATIKATENECRKLWPNACWGAANGWLMLLGPSPGGADKDETVRPGGANRPMDSEVSIGPCAGRIHFDSNQGRNRRWDRLREAVFGDLDHADALTTLANLDWGHNADHRSIPDAYLSMGCASVFEVMKQAKPRVIITLVRRTWDILLPFLESRQAIVPGYASATGLDCRLLRLPENGAQTLLLRSPQHPSRHFFSSDHERQIREEVQHFLNLPDGPMDQETP